jgi:hypothetical protein
MFVTQKTKREIEVTLTMTMTEQEAAALATIVSHVGGSPSGPQGVASEISRALDRASIKPKTLGTGAIKLPDIWERFDSLRDN